MKNHPICGIIAAADEAINREDFDAVASFYTEDAVLVVRPGLCATGKEEIRKAFVKIAEYFNHSLDVKQQREMRILEAGDTALVLSRTVVEAPEKRDSEFSSERRATYVFRKGADGVWRCAVDNSYGTDLLDIEE